MLGLVVRSPSLSALTVNYKEDRIIVLWSGELLLLSHFTHMSHPVELIGTIKHVWAPSESLQWYMTLTYEDFKVAIGRLYKSFWQKNIFSMFHEDENSGKKTTWKASWRFLFEPPRVLCECGTVEHSSCCKGLAVRQCCMKFSRETCYSGNVATCSTMTIRKGFVLCLRVRQRGSSHVQHVHLHLPDLNEQASQKTHACPASLEYCTNITAFIWQCVHVMNILNKPFWGPWWNAFLSKKFRCLLRKPWRTWRKSGFSI